VPIWCAAFRITTTVYWLGVKGCRLRYSYRYRYRYKLNTDYYVVQTIVFWRSKWLWQLEQELLAQASWNVMAHAQKPDFFPRRKGRVNLNRRGRQFSRLLAAEVCVSAVVMLGTPCSEVVWRVLATHPIRQFPLHFPSRASPCAITFQPNNNTTRCRSSIDRNLNTHRRETLKSNVLWK
jgi:hypothetical protein